MSPSCLESQGCHLIPLFISSLVFSALFSCSFCLVIFLLMVHSPDFFSLQKTLKYFSLSVRLFVWLLLSELGDDSWSVVCAACCHRALVFAIMHLCKIFYFILCLSIPCLYFSLTWYRYIRRNCRRYQHVLALCALLTGVILKELTLRNVLSDVCVFYVCEVIGFVD